MLILPAHPSHGSALSQLRQCHVPDSVDTVVIPVLRLVGVVSVLVLPPAVCPEVRQHPHAPTGDVHTVTLQYIQARHYAVLTLQRGRHPQAASLQLTDALRLGTVGNDLMLAGDALLPRTADDIWVRQSRGVYLLIDIQLSMCEYDVLQCGRITIMNQHTICKVFVNIFYFQIIDITPLFAYLLYFG